MGFDKNFLWGGDISAAQCEGAWDEDGRAPTETDYMTLGSADSPRNITYITKEGTYGKCPVIITGKIPEGASYAIIEGENYPNHTAVDFYHHYKEDIGYFAEMGFKALNLSISWARIYPHGYKNGVNKKGIEFYRDVLAECKKYGIEPIVTLYKYDMPVNYIEKLGGWSNRALIEEYVEFARVCFEEYKELVNYWITFNEINVELLVARQHIPGQYDDLQEIYEKLHNQLLASAKAVKLAHEIKAEYKVGSMNCGIFTYPMTPDPKDVYENQKYKQDVLYYSADVQARGKYPNFAKRVWEENNIALNISEEDKETLLNGKVDYFAFSYYSTSVITTHKEGEDGKGNLLAGKKNTYLEASDWGWQIDSVGIRTALHELNDRYQLPLMIVENGLGAYDKLESTGEIHDPYHIKYMSEHIREIKKAVEEGVNLIGYTMWSCIDLCAASTGEVSKRYGFVYVDVDDQGKGTFKRYKKDSFYWYKEVIESNGEKI